MVNFSSDFKMGSSGTAVLLDTHVFHRGALSSNYAAGNNPFPGKCYRKLKLEVHKAFNVKCKENDVV